jgi:hypothetical protein
VHVLSKQSRTTAQTSASISPLHHRHCHQLKSCRRHLQRLHLCQTLVPLASPYASHRFLICLSLPNLPPLVLFAARLRLCYWSEGYNPLQNPFHGLQSRAMEACHVFESTRHSHMTTSGLGARTGYRTKCRIAQFKVNIQHI